MFFTLSQQGVCFLWSIVCGVFIALVYDVFKLLRSLVLKGKWGTFFCDFLFMVISALVSVMFSVGFSRGNTRYFIIAGELSGFFAYRFTVGRFTVRTFEFIFNKISRLFRKSADKIAKIGKKVLQVVGTVLYNIIRRIICCKHNVVFKRGRCRNETEIAE